MASIQEGVFFMVQLEEVVVVVFFQRKGTLNIYGQSTNPPHALLRETNG